MVKARTIAAVFVIIGVVALAFPSVASEAFDTQRPTSFSIGSENDGLVGAEETGNLVEVPGKGQNPGNPGRGQKIVIGRLINNFDSEVKITYRVQTSDPSIEADPVRDTVSLSQGETQSVTVSCVPPGEGGGGEGSAVVTAVVESAQADGIGLENAEFDFDVTYDCVPQDQGQGEPPGNNGDDE